MITMIACVANENVIGFKGNMPWSLPLDLKHFRKHTINETVVMGRKTFESLGGPLKDRDNLVLTSSLLDTTDMDRTWKSTKVQVLQHVRKYPEKEYFIIGGSEIYKEFLDVADKLLVTRLLANFDGDTYFPEIDKDQWHLENIKEGTKDALNPYEYYFMTYTRIKKK